ncbi:WD40 repeat-like protein [Ceratobasidium sp. AG-Ba]|nr:WD40 repeat-like protein [Ceratobasidium sp. AG-Ba]QRW07930.1 WD40 repeat-like protein [Ceratobasidium sp. AG-Ba]
MTTPSTALMGSIRHRIQAIELDPSTSKCPVSLKLLVDGNLAYRMPEISPGDLLLWDRIPPRDVAPSSRIEIRVHERYAFIRRRCIGSVDYKVSDLGSQPGAVSRLLAAKSLSVLIKFATPESAQDAAVQALSHAQGSQPKERFLEKLKVARGVIEAVLGFGSAIAELDPRAKAVFAVVSKVWEKLEAQAKCDSSVESLLDGLSAILPSAQAVQEAAKLKELRETIEAMWKMIEDAARFIDDYRSKGEVVLTLGQYHGSNAQEQVNDILARLQDLKEKFDRGIRIQTLQTGETTLQIIDKHVQSVLLEKLKPVGRARYDPARACMPGTRELVIRDLLEWVNSSGDSSPPNSRRLLWVHGQAGLGKSAIATSLCQILDDQHLLAASFFCKRDESERRSAQLVLSTIIYGIASRHATYANYLRKVLEEDSLLPSSPLQMQFNKLVLDLLRPSFSGDQSTPHVVVVDALDECGPEADRRQLLGFLVKISELVPGLSVIVTSRPDPDIKQFFGPANLSKFPARDLYTYDASNDIRTFTRFRLGESVKGRLLPENSADELAKSAAGLFIWAHTACEFILEDIDPVDAFSSILRQSQSGQSYPLDELYTRTIQASVAKQQYSNRTRAAVRKYLGAIIVCSTRTPLSVSALSGLLGEDHGANILQSAVDLLGSVLYIDHSMEDAVRVYHPSFADYMLSKDRSGEFCVDLDEQNTQLANCCLRTMMAHLRFNMCDLATSYKRNCEVPDLESRVARAISNHLKYSCLYWTSHIRDIQTPERRISTQSKLYELDNTPTLIFWIEVLSLIGKLSVAISGIQELVNYYATHQLHLPGYIRDISRLLGTFYQPISESTPHLYITALALMPTNISIRRLQRKYFPNLLKVAHGAQNNWPNRNICMSHEDVVSAVAISCDGRKIVSGSLDKKLYIWDADTGAQIGEALIGHSGSVTSVAYSPDGRRIVSGSEDGTVRIWDANTGAQIGDLLVGHEDPLISVAYSLDGRYIVSGSGAGPLYVWDADIGARIGEPFVGHQSPVWSVAYSPCGRRIVSGSMDCTVRVWDADTGAQIGEPLVGHHEPVFSVAFSPDGQRIISGSEDWSVLIWDTETGAQIGQRLVGHENSVTSVAYSPDGRHIVSASLDGTVCIWDAETGAQIGEPLVAHSSSISSVAYSPDGRRIVSGSQDRTVQVCSADMVGMTDTYQVAQLSSQKNTPPMEDLFEEISYEIISIAYSPCGRRIASGSADRTVRVWDADTGTQIGEPLVGHEDLVTSVAYSPDGRYIVSGSGDGTVRIWDTETGAQIGEPLVGHEDPVTSVTYSPDGRYIVSGSEDETVCIWDANRGTQIGEPLVGHEGSVTSVAFSPDGQRIISGSEDWSVLIWDTETGAQIGQRLVGHEDSVTSVACSPDGQYIVSGSDDGTVRIWDVETGAPISEPLVAHSSSISSVAYSPDGRRIVSGSDDKTLRIWDVDTGEQIGEPLAGHLNLVLSVAYSPDGRSIASVAMDDTVRVWDGELVGQPMNPIYEFCQSARSSPRSSQKQAVQDETLGFQESHPIPARYQLQCAFCLEKNLSYSGWVSVNPGQLLIWLPFEYRRTRARISDSDDDDSETETDFQNLCNDHSMQIISTQKRAPPVWFDLSAFSCGLQWTDVYTP